MKLPASESPRLDHSKTDAVSPRQVRLTPREASSGSLSLKLPYLVRSIVMFSRRARALRITDTGDLPRCGVLVPRSAPQVSHHRFWIACARRGADRKRSFQLGDFSCIQVELQGL